MGGKLKIYVLTMREIFCQCMEKAGAVENGKSLEKRGRILIDGMKEQFGNSYKVLEEDNRESYYNDRITALYRKIDAGRFKEINGYYKNVIDPLIEYAGYQGKITELDRFFRDSDISLIPKERLRSFTPLLKAGEVEFAPEEQADLAGDASKKTDLAPQPRPAFIDVLYSTNPFGLLRFPAEGRLILTNNNSYKFISADNKPVNLGDNVKTELIRCDDRDGAWLKVTYNFDGQPGCLYLAEFAEPSDADEFYTLVYPSAIIASLSQTMPAKDE